MSRILLLASQHGDETLGRSLFQYMQNHNSPALKHIDYFIGNPKAYSKGVRFIDTDMNRSYVSSPATYEERRAKEVLDKARVGNYSLVLDLHTTNCVQPPCIIVSDLNNTTKRFITASKIQKVVKISHQIVNQSLIGVYPEAISIEVNQKYTNSFLKQLSEDILRFIEASKLRKSTMLFNVNKLLKKSTIAEAQLSKLENFKPSKYGYPILIGENSYSKNTSYWGFCAEKKYRIKL